MYRSGPVRSVCKDRSHRSLKLVLLFFSKILLSLRKPPKPSFPPRSKTLDPILCQKVIIFPTRPDRSSVRSGSQRNILIVACKTCESILLRPFNIIFELILCESASLLQQNYSSEPNTRPVTNKRPGWVLGGLAHAPHVGNRVPNKRPGWHGRHEQQHKKQHFVKLHQPWPRSSHLARDLGKIEQTHPEAI